VVIDDTIAEAVEHLLRALKSAGLTQSSMSLDAALDAVPALLAEIRDLRRELRELRAIVSQSRVRQVTRAEAAVERGCSTHCIDAMIKRGDLRAEKVGRHVRVILEPLATDAEVSAAAARALA
jgi:cell division septum initiation protein DivIVA